MSRWRRNKQQIGKDIDNQTKVCCVCDTRKPFSDFYNYKNKSDGKSYRCKSCDTLARKAYELKHTIKSSSLKKLRRIKHLYKLDEVSYLELMDSQKGCCKICNESLYDPQNDVQFSIDHEDVYKRQLIIFILARQSSLEGMERH